MSERIKDENIIEHKHSAMVLALAKPGVDILKQMTDEQAHALHMAVGASGEAGELLDAIKKWVIYQKPLDLNNVIEELGDLEFYLEGLRRGLCISREQTLMANMEKLAKRYPGYQYSNAHAIARADKEGTA
ncbi:nucleoside triphosphate pyrophosphohydrolase family protein [Aeromonas sp. R7-1]|uniref:nucleoside triphosphate pyrophosphohydrolase family protein n=1 Tax=Aeromonas sp. R7-1 TaxID=3138473 RepID=UPI0034A33EA1